MSEVEDGSTICLRCGRLTTSESGDTWCSTCGWEGEEVFGVVEGEQAKKADILYVPWHQRRVRWLHDHNAPDDRDPKRAKVLAVGKLTRARRGLFYATCLCGTMFVAEVDHHVVNPPVAALGVL